VNAVHGTVIIVPVSSSSERSYPPDDPLRVHVGAFAKAPVMRQDTRGRSQTTCALLPNDV